VSTDTQTRAHGRSRSRPLPLPAFADTHVAFCNETVQITVARTAMHVIMNAGRLFVSVPSAGNIGHFEFSIFNALVSPFGPLLPRSPPRVGPLFPAIPVAVLPPPSPRRALEYRIARNCDLAGIGGNSGWKRVVAKRDESREDSTTPSPRREIYLRRRGDSRSACDDIRLGARSGSVPPRAQRRFSFPRDPCLRFLTMLPLSSANPRDPFLGWMIFMDGGDRSAAELGPPADFKGGDFTARIITLLAVSHSIAPRAAPACNESCA